MCSWIQGKEGQWGQGEFKVGLTEKHFIFRERMYPEYEIGHFVEKNALGVVKVTLSNKEMFKTKN